MWLLLRDLNQNSIHYFSEVFQEVLKLTEDQTPRIWVNNAGNSVLAPIYLQSEEEIAAQLNVHILATTCFSRLFLQRATENKTQDQFILINTSSINAYMKPAYLSLYNAAKSYILTFSETLGKEVKNKRIQIVVTTPGPV